MGKIEGIIVPMITPFKEEDYSLDLEAAKWMAKYLSEKGVHGIFPNSTTGEFVHLTPEEALKLTSTVLEEVKAKTKVMPGVSANCTLHSIQLAKKTKDLGVDAVIATPPYYFKLTEEQIYKHFAMLAEAVDIPIIVYNIPVFTGNPIPVDVYVRLAREYSNIAGAKITYDSVSYLCDLIMKTKEVRKDFAVLTGLDNFLLYTLLLGGDGGILGTANIAPQLHLKVYNSLKEGNLAQAIQAQKQVIKLLDAVTLTPVFPWAVKVALKHIGAPIKPIVRPPLTPDKPEVEQVIKTTLKELKLIS